MTSWKAFCAELPEEEGSCQTPCLEKEHTVKEAVSCQGSGTQGLAVSITGRVASAQGLGALWLKARVAASCSKREGARRRQGDREKERRHLLAEPQATANGVSLQLGRREGLCLIN